MHRKNLEKNITELLSPKKWRNLEKVGHTFCRILKCQGRPTSNRTFTSTIPQKALQILISKIELQHICMPRKFRETRCKGHTGETGECTTHSSWSKGKFDSHSSEGQKASGENPFEQGNLIRNANPSNLRGYLLESKKDHLFNQASWRSKSHIPQQTSASVNYNDKRKSKDWHHKTHNTDLLKLDENKLDCKKNCQWKKKFSETLKSEICTKWRN